MYRVVLDTNVFVSGVSLHVFPPSHILDLWRKQAFTLVISPQLIIEFEEVLLRPGVFKYTQVNSRQVRAYMDDFRTHAFITEGLITLDVLVDDPDDNIVLAAAVEGLATHIITGNKKHFPFPNYKGISIVSPREFLSLINE